MGNDSLIQGLIDGSAIKAITPLLVDAQGRAIVSAIVSPLPAGNNNIGNVDIVTMPSIPAGTNRIGSAGIEGYFGGGWRKAALPFGAYTQHKEIFSGTASNPNVLGGTVAANWLRVVTNIGMNLSAVGAISNVRMMLDDGTFGYYVYSSPTFTSGNTAVWDGWLVLWPGQGIRWAATGTSIVYNFTALGFNYPTNL